MTKSICKKGAEASHSESFETATPQNLPKTTDYPLPTNNPKEQFLPGPFACF